MKTLYVSDLDGTLLRPDETLSPYTVETLNRLIAGGLLFTFATARSMATAAFVTKNLSLELPAILNNGAFITERDSGKVLHMCAIDSAHLAPVRAMLAGEGVSALVYAMLDGRERVSWITGGESPGVRTYVDKRRAWDQRLRPVENPDELFAGDVFYVTAIEHDQALARRLHETYKDSDTLCCTMTEDIYRPEEYWVELYRRDVSKAAAVARLREMVGAERTVCFGDGLNDAPMFRTCDEAYAVDNADDRLKPLATAVIGSNTEDGVARFLAARLET